jgi:SAM-dependent methyltransferase
MKTSQDAYGTAMYDFHRGRPAALLIERDDGYIDLDLPMTYYFAQYRDWRAHEKAAIKHATGRVLDVGCGAGRHALYLQKRGMEVLGIDVSPQAIKTSKLRGLRVARVCSVASVNRRLGVFATILMLGNNFGLFGSFGKAKTLLRRFHGLTSEGAWIIAECLDPYDTSNPSHLAYQRRNEARGRMAGQLRLRARYQGRATPWFDYLFVSRIEMAKIVDRTGWRITKTLSGRGPTYIALIHKVTAGV